MTIARNQLERSIERLYVLHVVTVAAHQQCNCMSTHIVHYEHNCITFMNIMWSTDTESIDGNHKTSSTKLAISTRTTLKPNQNMFLHSRMTPPASTISLLLSIATIYYSDTRTRCMLPDPSGDPQKKEAPVNEKAIKILWNMCRELLNAGFDNRTTTTTTNLDYIVSVVSRSFETICVVVFVWSTWLCRQSQDIFE